MSRPRGDPGAMRREADRLRDLAGRISGMARDLPDVTHDTFRGPAGERLRGNLSDRRAAINRAAGIVRSAADRLSDEASRLDAAQRAWDDEQRRAREAEERRRQQARSFRR